MMKTPLLSCRCRRKKTGHPRVIFSVPRVDQSFLDIGLLILLYSREERARSRTWGRDWAVSYGLGSGESGPGRSSNTTWPPSRPPGSRNIRLSNILGSSRRTFSVSWKIRCSATSLPPCVQPSVNKRKNKRMRMRTRTRTTASGGKLGDYMEPACWIL